MDSQKLEVALLEGAGLRAPLLVLDTRGNADDCDPMTAADVASSLAAVRAFAEIALRRREQQWRDTLDALTEAMRVLAAHRPADRRMVWKPMRRSGPAPRPGRHGATRRRAPARSSGRPRSSGDDDPPPVAARVTLDAGRVA